MVSEKTKNKMKEIVNKYSKVEKIVEGYSKIIIQGTSRVVTVQKIPKCDVGERCFYIIGYDGIDPLEFDMFMDEFKLESIRTVEDNIKLNLFSDILNSIGYTLKKTDDKSTMFRNFLKLRRILYTLDTQKKTLYGKQEKDLLYKIRDSKNEEEHQQHQRKLNQLDITKERIIQGEVQEEFLKTVQEKKNQLTDVNKQKLLRILSESAWYDFQNNIIQSALEMKWVDVVSILIKSQSAKQKWVEKAGISEKTIFKTLKRTTEDFEKGHYHKYTRKMIKFMEGLESDERRQEIFITFQGFLNLTEIERKAREKMIREYDQKSKDFP